MDARDRLPRNPGRASRGHRRDVALHQVGRALDATTRHRSMQYFRSTTERAEILQNVRRDAVDVRRRQLRERRHRVAAELYLLEKVLRIGTADVRSGHIVGIVTATRGGTVAGGAVRRELIPGQTAA